MNAKLLSIGTQVPDNGAKNLLACGVQWQVQ